MTTKAIVFLPLSQGKVAVIDFEDFEKVRGVKWYAHKPGRCFYARRSVLQANGKKTAIFLHRVLTGCPADLEVNHINGDGLDNRRDNLQICTRQQNNVAHKLKRKNATSKYRGVCWYERDDCWLARIYHTEKAFHIGYFDDEEDAARAYDAKATELFGEHAALNFSKTKTQS